MDPANHAVLLRLYVDEDEQVSGRPLYEVVFRKAREMRPQALAVLRGPRGLDFGRRRHHARLLTLLTAESLPVIVEVVDRAEPVRAFLESIRPLMRQGLATLQEVELWSCGQARPDATPLQGDRQIPL